MAERKKYLFKKAGKTTKGTIKSELDLDMFDITIDETGSRDLGILGLGWVSFIGNNQKLRIIVPKGTFIFNIRSKIDHVNK